MVFSKIAEQKTKEIQNLVEAVNEVKKIEMELDRANAQCKELNSKIVFEENNQKVYFIYLLLN